MFDFDDFTENIKSVADTVTKSTSSHHSNFRFPHHAFEYHVGQTPHKTAFKYLSESGAIETLTFAQLNDKADHCSRFLRSLRLEKEEALPIMLKQDHLFYVVVLACLKAGIVFTPIDLKLPQERKLFMLDELQAHFMVCERTSMDGLQVPENIRIIDMNDTGCVENSTEEFIEVHRDLNDLAFRLYTSGS